MSGTMTKSLLRNRKWGRTGHWRSKRYGSVRLRNRKIPRSASVYDRFWRMSDELDGSGSSLRNSEIRERDIFLDLLSKVQDNRYENQRHLLKVESDTRSDGSNPNEQPSRKDSSGIIPINGTIPNGDIHGLHVPSVEVSPTSQTPPIPNGTIHTGEVEGSEGRESLSPPPILPQSASTPSRRSMAALKKMLSDEGPYPLLVEPPDAGYWIQNGNYGGAKGEDGVWRAPEISTDHYRINTDKTAFVYGKHFTGREHRNYIARCSKQGPVLFSLKVEETYQGPVARMILRTHKETYHQAIPISHLPEQVTEVEDYIRYMGSVNGENLSVGEAVRIFYPKAPELIQKFDEHMMAKTHKFGVIYQQFGQTSEEELFDNQDHPEALEEFLELLGEKVALKGFKGYRAGLDVTNDQTGEHSVYTEHKDRQIMFHVSTLLPHDPSDTQHVQRKRHIGNDIVLIVFQDENTPFCPNTVRSHFIHACIVVQVEHPNTDYTVYKVAVAAKENVPDFGPPLPDPAIFQKGPEFRDWLLTKLLNAEFNCHLAPDFKRLATRTRNQLFIHLIEEIAQTMEDVDYPGLAKRLTMSVDPGMSEFPSPGSRRRRRRTLAGIFTKDNLPTLHLPSFTKRKSIAGSPRNFRSSRAVMIGSTPDLSLSLYQGRDSPPSIQSENEGSDPQKTDGPTKTKVKRRFTFRKEKEKKKAKRSVSITAGTGMGLTEFLSKRKWRPSASPKDQGSERPLRHDSSEESSIASGLNWSIPCDLPGAVEGTGRRMGRTSLESLTIDSADFRSRYHSNPTILERKESESGVSVSGVRISNEDGPMTADVAVQVGRRDHVFKFPSPLSPSSPLSLPSVVGTEGSPFEESHSLPTTPFKARRPTSGVRKLPTTQEVRERYDRRSSSPQQVQVAKSRSGRTRHGRHDRRDKKLSHVISSPVLGESPSPHNPSSIRRPASSEGFADNRSYSFEDEAGGRLVYRAESIESVSSEVDDVYESLLQSLQALTMEVTRLNQHNLVLRVENAKFASQNRKLQVKYCDAKQQLAEAQQQIHTLQLKLKLYQPDFPKLN